MEFDPRLNIRESDETYKPSDDSYLLLAAVAVQPGERFLEVGTGTGLIALHAARIARATATDVNPHAVRLARENALANGLPADLLRGDLATALRGPFDVIAFNPPYLAGLAADDLDRAWHGGDRGTDVTLRFLQDLPRVLASTGRAYLIVLRDQEEVWKTAEARFRVRVLASRPLFFESIHVLELRLPRTDRGSVRSADPSSGSPTSRPHGRSRVS